MKITKKQGIFQIEDWTENYPGMIRPYTVACYPTATRNGNNSHWFTIGSTIRIGLDFDTMQEAETCFAALTAGTKKIKDFTAHANNPRTLDWID